MVNLDAGHLRVGDRADTAIIDPARLDESVHGPTERELPAYNGLRRMVNPGTAVTATIVSGRVVFHDGRFTDGLGEQWGPGRFLPAGEKVRAPGA
ncbi:hypothetical protein [Nocardia sp. NPDC051833]|uniref:hypothetical protein n=1 Tax=Nocardia sp. NPDC051833 TaxID=3155674 RepID=UPI0034480B2C